MNKFIKNVGYLTFSILCGRFVNIILPFLIVNIYGSNRETDFLFIAFSISIYFYGILFNALVDSSVPKLIVDHKLISTKHNYLIATIAFIATFFILIFFRGYVSSTEFYIIGASFSGIAACGTLAFRSATILAANEKYNLQNLLWMTRFMTIPILLISSNQSKLGLSLFAISLLFSDALRFALINIFGKRFDLSTNLNKINDNFDGKILIYIGAALIHGFNPIIDRLIASYGVPGSITLLELSERMYNVILTIITSGFFGVITVDMSNRFYKNKFSQYWNLLLLGGLSMGLAALGIAFLIGMVIKGNLGQVILPKLKPDQLILIKDCLLIYCGSIPAFILGGISVRILLIKQEYFTILKLAFLSIIINFIFSLVLFNLIGLPGIAFATTLSYSLTALLMILRCSSIIGTMPATKAL